MYCRLPRKSANPIVFASRTRKPFGPPRCWMYGCPSAFAVARKKLLGSREEAGEVHRSPCASRRPSHMGIGLTRSLAGLDRLDRRGERDSLE